jgi:hypothetical protein
MPKNDEILRAFDLYEGKEIQIFRRSKGSMAPLEIICKCGYSTTAMPFWVGKFQCAFCNEIMMIPDDH